MRLSLWLRGLRLRELFEIRVGVMWLLLVVLNRLFGRIGGHVSLNGVKGLRMCRLCLLVFNMGNI